MYAINPATQQPLPGEFPATPVAEIDRLVQKTHQAFAIYRQKSGKEKAAFLRAIADEILALGDELIQRAVAESGLPEGRITGERGRTVGQLRMFADYVAEGSWVDARIDFAQPERQPLPKPDIRQMLVPVGVVVVFTASNFPLAFSTAGEIRLRHWLPEIR
ncbi:MAG: aldehyde dehydrogenase family protein [Bacteroidia bacterium]